MIVHCGPTFENATEAEVQFAFNVMSFFQKFLKKSIFVEWVEVTFYFLNAIDHAWTQ